jgi:hypothetical protein
MGIVLERVRAWCGLRALWLRRLWADEGGPSGAFGAVTHAEADAALTAADHPSSEAQWRRTEAPLDAVQRAETADRALAGLDGRIARLAEVLGLDPPDRDLVQLAMAAAMDRSIARLLAYLHDDADRPAASEQLARRVFGHDVPTSWPADSALFRWRIVTRHGGPLPGTDHVTVDPQITTWCLGHAGVDPALAGAAELLTPAEPLAGWPVATATAAVRRLVEQGHAVRLVVRGTGGTGRRTFAACVCAALGLPALAVDPAGGGVDAELVVRVWRQAFLDSVAPVWIGATDWPRVGIAPFPIQIVIADPGRRLSPLPRVVDSYVDLPAATTSDRRRLWTQLPGTEGWAAGELDALAARHRATPGEIRQVGLGGPTTAHDAARRIRRLTAERAGDLAQRLECPFEPDDLVVPAHLRDVLDDLVHEASSRTEFWEQTGPRRLFPTGRSLVALFAGPPGTGKTMAAQVIAGQLRFDLWRIDLAALVSKYVGETAQNVDRLLRQASGSDVVLFFDEADALYGKRATEVRDAQDRYVNMDTGHLMVAIENHDGVVLLATNQKGAVDPAFVRRLRYVVDFPKPDAAQRRAIWERIVAELASPAAAGALAAELDVLADSVEATGSQIKYAVLGAVFAARRAGADLARAHLLIGLNRELVKEGRSLSGRDLDRLVRR